VEEQNMIFENDFSQNVSHHIFSNLRHQQLPIVGQKNSAISPLSLVITLLIGTANCKPEGRCWTVK
jgi:hypothetical protein